MSACLPHTFRVGLFNSKLHPIYTEFLCCDLEICYRRYRLIGLAKLSVVYEWVMVVKLSLYVCLGLRDAGRWIEFDILSL